MILNDATVTYIDGVNVEIPMKNIKTIHIERREVDVRTEDES